MIGVELGEGTAAGLIQLLEGDPAVLVAVGAVEAALLLAARIGRRRPAGAASPIAGAGRPAAAVPDPSPAGPGPSR